MKRAFLMCLQEDAFSSLVFTMFPFIFIILQFSSKHSLQRLHLILNDTVFPFVKRQLFFFFVGGSPVLFILFLSLDVYSWFAILDLPQFWAHCFCTLLHLMLISSTLEITLTLFVKFSPQLYTTLFIITKYNLTVPLLRWSYMLLAADNVSKFLSSSIYLIFIFAFFYLINSPLVSTSSFILVQV